MDVSVIWNISKMANSTEKWVKIWALACEQLHILGNFHLTLLAFISLQTWPVAQKRLFEILNEITFRLQGFWLMYKGGWSRALKPVALLFWIFWGLVQSCPKTIRFSSGSLNDKSVRNPRFSDKAKFLYMVLLHLFLMELVYTWFLMELVYSLYFLHM